MVVAVAAIPIRETAVAVAAASDCWARVTMGLLPPITSMAAVVAVVARRAVGRAAMKMKDAQEEPMAVAAEGPVKTLGQQAVMVQ